VGGGAHLKLSGIGSGLGRKLFMTVAESIQKFNVSTGCFIFCRKSSFDEIGGFNEMFFALEEFWFCRSMIRWGKKNNMPFRLLKNQSVESSDRKFNSSYSILKLCLPLLVPFFFFSRKLCFFWYKR